MPESLNEPMGQAPNIRRSFTLPTKLNPSARRGSQTPKSSENVIFYHPSAKIVHFAPRALAPIPSSSAPTDFDYPVDTVETLPWRSATERTVATAPLRLERVHGLTAFLKCGNVVHAILKNSQCWCVDGVSKFVLRIRPLTYYRIEIPYETDEDKELVGELKGTLPTILRYEVTPCPFKRAFTVDLPEDAMAPRRKRAWRPKERKDGLFPASGSSQGSPSETRSEWLDSASTGEDTDGGATDDSALAPQRTNSSVSDAVPTGDESPSSTDKIVLPSVPKSTRRSVTETPQTFTSLLAKFDATPAPESTESTDLMSTNYELKDPVGQNNPIPIPEVTVEPAVDLVDAQPSSPIVEASSISSPKRQSVAESVSNIESTSNAVAPNESLDVAPQSQAMPVAVLDSGIEEKSTAEIAAKDEPEVKTETSEVSASSLETPEAININEAPETTPEITAHPTTTPSATSGTLPENETSTKPPVFLNPFSQSTPQPPTDATDAEVAPTPTPTPISTSVTPATSEPIPVPDQEATHISVLDQDHDSSFSSTPESFHSVEAPSPSKSVSTQPPLVEVHNLPKQDDDFSTSPKTRTSRIMTQGPAFEDDGLPSKNASFTANAPSPEMQSTSVKSSTHDDSPTSSLAIPSATRSSPAPAVKSSPPTDFDHMSSEFRRRSKATRERDVSPMPPSAAIYQPRAGDEASTFLSKALTLVLVPPVSLFIVLLHVAARIVISPAFNSTSDESSQSSRPPNKSPVIDDFSFPLDRQSSSDYDDAEITKKLDPWDLD